MVILVVKYSHIGCKRQQYWSSIAAILAAKAALLAVFLYIDMLKARRKT